jgi:hypothetical protein
MPALSRFVDLFHHRALSLFYRAWADIPSTVASTGLTRTAGHYIGWRWLSTPRLRADAMPDERISRVCWPMNATCGGLG